MLTTSITDAKNRLSALIDRVKHGETIVITDRGRPVARLTPTSEAPDADVEGRLSRLERQGAIRRSQGSPALRLILGAPPSARPGVDILHALLRERMDEPAEGSTA